MSGLLLLPDIKGLSSSFKKHSIFYVWECFEYAFEQYVNDLLVLFKALDQFQIHNYLNFCHVNMSLNIENK